MSSVQELVDCMSKLSLDDKNTKSDSELLSEYFIKLIKEPNQENLTQKIEQMTNKKN